MDDIVSSTLLQTCTSQAQTYNFTYSISDGDAVLKEEVQRRHEQTCRSTNKSDEADCGGHGVVASHQQLK
jgi:hypothetical protein